ncbi:MAG: hypothetical protein U0176_17700 [Bacteroidia bacterium]
MMKHRILPILAALMLLVVACDKGEKLPNVAPDTRIALESIHLTGEDRLRSEVTLNWFGTDEDGWVTGYEISFDGTNWQGVDVQDSTFKFNLSVGSDTTDINFYVRSLDNEGDYDPTPAYLLVPIRNSAPTARFDSVQTIPDTSFIVTTIFLDVQDLDGEDNVDSIFLKFNNGAWFPLAKDVRTITVVPDNPVANGATTAKCYLGASATLAAGTLTGVNLNGDNVCYVKARDIALAESVEDTSKTFFIKHKSSDLLVIDAHPGGTSPTPEEVYAQTLDLVEPNADRIDLRVNNGLNVPRLWSPTFSTFINFYDRIFWYSDGSDAGVTLLEDASGALQGYLNQGGKILMNLSFPNTFDNNSVLQEYTPLDSVSTSPGSARLPTGNMVMPTAAFDATYDSLEASVFLGRATPIYVKSTAEIMYTGDFTISGGWVGPDNVIARSINGSGHTNLVLASVELHVLFGQPTNLQNFFNQVLLNEFNW